MISIAIATYNGEKYIKKQIESILAQSEKVDEIVICDDCSNDSTVQIIKEIMQNNNDTVKLFENNENIGYSKNFRQAVEKCNGDYIFFSDQDDIWENNKVEKYIDIMNDADVNVICSDYKLIDEKDELLDKSLFAINNKVKTNKRISKVSTYKLLFGNVSPGCTYCFKKSIKDLFLREENEEVIHDYAIALLGSLNNGLVYLNEKTIKYRIHDQNSIGIKKADEKKQVVDINNRNKKPYILKYLENYYDLMTKRKRLAVKIILYLRLPLIKIAFKNIGKKKQG